MRPARTVYAAAIAAALLAGPAAAAPDRTQGMALMSATVKSDGTLVSGSGAVSVEKTAVPGTYNVQFRRVLTGCTRIAGLSSAEFANFATPAGMVTNEIFEGAEFGAFMTVRTFDADGDSADADFHIIVFCPK